ncbi:class I SAM-dependent methyltransferase [Chloroflexota bacterium]
MFPPQLMPLFEDGRLKIPEQPERNDPFLQYYQIWAIKHNVPESEIESIVPNPNDPWKHRNYENAHQFIKVEKSVLDIGCGSPSFSWERLRRPTHYFGLDSLYVESSSDIALGVSEYLPIVSDSFENVTILGVLDHVLDYARAIDEAWRVLENNGHLWLSALAWTEHYELDRDIVHFHHFKEYELMGALRRFSIDAVQRFPWKEDYRTVLYVKAKKVASTG